MTAGTSPLSFVTCASNGATLRTNLLASPCSAPQAAHQAVAVRNCPSAADGLNIGTARAETDWVVCVHQDVWLPAGWDRCVLEQLDEAERRFGPVGVAGVYGVGEMIAPREQSQPMAAQRIGWVVDRGQFYRSAEVFSRKWQHRLPVATPCVIIDRGGIVHVPGNATTEGLRSIAHTYPRDGSTEAGVERTSTSRTSLG